MKNVLLYIIMYVCTMLLAVSCEHKEFCYHHPHTANVSVVADWAEFDNDTPDDVPLPTGMTVLVYPQYEGNATECLTNNLDYATFSLPVGKYNSVVFNQSESEYGSVSFRGMNRYETAEVLANSTKSSWYETRKEDERVVVAPEWIATSRHEGAEVTQEMVDYTGEQLLANAYQRNSLGFVIARHIPRNIIYTIKVIVKIEGGFYNFRAARASLSGLSEGYFFATGKYSKNAVTQLLENWKPYVNPADPTKGYIVDSIQCFGLPDGHLFLPDENQFDISVLLVDNRTKVDYKFLVGDKFVYEERTDDGLNERVKLKLELTLVLDTLPDVKPDGGSGNGFDATVDDWGDEEDYEITI